MRERERGHQRGRKRQGNTSNNSTCLKVLAPPCYRQTDWERERESCPPTAAADGLWRLPRGKKNMIDDRRTRERREEISVTLRLAIRTCNVRILRLKIICRIITLSWKDEMMRFGTTIHQFSFSEQTDDKFLGVRVRALRCSDPGSTSTPTSWYMSEFHLWQFVYNLVVCSGNFPFILCFPLSLCGLEVAIWVSLVSSDEITSPKMIAGWTKLMVW